MTVSASAASNRLPASDTISSVMSETPPPDQDASTGSVLSDIDLDDVLDPHPERKALAIDSRALAPRSDKSRSSKSRTGESRTGPEVSSIDALNERSALPRERPPQRASVAPLAWLLLLLPLAGLLYQASTFDRTTWPSLLGDEAVYLMAAQSLAWDNDFRYTKADQDRFIEQMQRTPDGLILQSPDQGRTLYYGKSWLYPLAIAPFVKAMPQNGYAVANTVYLIIASLLAAWALSSVLGSLAPLFVSAFVFASITFAHVFWAHADLFLMCCVAIGCSLILKPWFDAQRQVRLAVNLPGDRNAAKQASGSSRGSAAIALAYAARPYLVIATGCVLLVVVVLARPLYAPLLLIPLVAAPNLKRLAAVVLCVAAATAGLASYNTNLTGVWSPYVGERQAFYGYTGFPDSSTDSTPDRATDGTTDGTTDDSAQPHPGWKQAIEERGDTSWTAGGVFQFPFEIHQFLWNMLYVFIGRNTGLFPYFLPFLIGLLAFRSDRVNWTLMLTVSSVMVLFLLLRPFNYYGGGGALANRYFLPIYPLFWFLMRRPISWRWPALLTTLAVFTLLPKWIDPTSYWRTPQGAFTHVSEVAERFLPHETTQSNLKPSDQEDINYRTPSGKPLWLKPLSPRISSPDQGRTLFLKPGPNRAEVVAASEKPIRAFRIEVEGQDTRTARFARPSARHRMWWSFDVLYLYRFDLEGGEFGVDRRRRVRITPLAAIKNRNG